MKRNRWAGVYAMRRAQNEYRQNGIPPQDLWDRGTHFARFEAMGRLRTAIYRFRVLSPGSPSHEVARLRREVGYEFAAVRAAACPVLP